MSMRFRAYAYSCISRLGGLSGGLPAAESDCAFWIQVLAVFVDGEVQAWAKAYAERNKSCANFFPGRCGD